jgi:diguanylate cyclase (GGDEF)-like protein
VNAQLVVDIALGAAALVALGWGAAWLVRLVRTVRDGEKRLARLERLAVTDELTGLPNRRQWDEHLPRELGRSLRYDEPICVAMLDLDNFDEYTDAHGHQAGDRLLKEVCAAWRTAVRPYDLLARHGSEGFGLILHGCPLDEAVGILERMRSLTPAEASCSVGVAEWDRNEDPPHLVDRAEQALDDAKRGGRNQAVAAASPLTH